MSLSLSPLGRSLQGSWEWAVPAVRKVLQQFCCPSHPCLTIQGSGHLLDVGEAVVSLQSSGDADGSFHVQGVFLQAAGSGRVRKHQPGRCGYQEGMHVVGIGKSPQLRGLCH